MNYKPIIDYFKSTWEWYDSKTPTQKLRIISSALFAFFCYSYVINIQKESENTQQRIADLEAQVTNCSKLMDEKHGLEDELLKMKMNSIMLKASSDYLPFPFWIKDREGRMVYVNRAYETKYLRPRGFTATDYIGHRDEAVWSEQLSKEFRTNDSIVLANNKPMTFVELNGKVFTKFPVQLGSYVMGVGGVEYITYNP